MSYTRRALELGEWGRDGEGANSALSPSPGSTLPFWQHPSPFICLSDAAGEWATQERVIDAQAGCQRPWEGCGPTFTSASS